MRKYIILLLLLPAVVFLSACGGTLSIALETTPTPDQAPAATLQALEAQIATMQPSTRPGLDMNASPGAIRQVLLESHQNWQTLWLDAQITTTASGSPERQRAQLWIDRPEARFRSLSGPLDAAPQVMQVSDGATQARTNLANGATQSQPLMEGVRNLNWQAPATADAAPSDATGILSHPLDLEIDSPLSELAFPVVLAQQGGDFVPTAMEKVAGRLALVVEHSFDAQLRARVWIDTQTGIILRWDSFAKDNASSSPATSIQVQNLAFDAPFSADLFDLRLKEKPQYAMDASGFSNPTPLPPAAEFRPGEGELYFVIDRSPERLQLARLPGSCVEGSSACPAPQEVEGYPNENNMIEPLIWSPDARLAALVHQGMLYSFDPENSAWKELAQFPILREGMAWSADGSRLAFTAQQADYIQDVYIVNADGTNLTNLTGGAFQGKGVSLWVDGFLADGRLLFEVITGSSAKPYLIQPREGAVPQPFQELTMQHGVLALAPNRRLAAFTTNQDGVVTLNLAGIALDGSETANTVGEAQRLATFQQAAIQQLLWFSVGSPDASAPAEQWIAFVVASGSSPEENVNTVYIIRPDGTDLRQLYQNQAIHRLTVAGNGRYLIAAFAGGPPALIPIAGAEARPLEAPGLRLDQPILGISWR